MLSTVGVWLALRCDTRGLTTLGVFLLVGVLATLAWNLVP